jgi:hypothetical protein
LINYFGFKLKEDMSQSDLETGKSGPRVTQQPTRTSGMDNSEMNSGGAIPLGNTTNEQQRLFNK